MLGTASSLSTRIVSTRLICLGAVLLAVLSVLALSPAARADSTVQAPEGLSSEQSSEPTSGGEVGGAESQPSGGTESVTLETTGTEGSAIEALGEESSGVEAGPAPAESVPPVSESPPEPTPAPEPEPGPPVLVEMTPEPAPVAQEVLKEAASEATSHSSSEETEKPKEKTAEAVMAMSGSPSEPTGTTTGLIAGGESEGSPPSGPVPPTGSEIVQLGEGQAALSGSTEEALTSSRAASERQAVAKRCELSALGGPEAGGCDGGWLGAANGLSQAPVALVSDATALTPAAVGSSGDDGPGGVAGGGHPLVPSPGPAPGGASGGVAAGGSGSVGLSGFLTLAGLLLLAAPRALRRLRLSCRPWLTAFFVLIPERPG
jgi:outer membrane biosynthesis protein TonB